MNSTPTPPSSEIIFDRDGVLDRLMGGEALAAKVMTVFINTFPSMMEELHRAIDAGDTVGAQRQAHSIKGAASNMGGNRIMTLALEMELAAKEGNLDQVRTQFHTLQTAFDAFHDAVNDAPFSAG